MLRVILDTNVYGRIMEDGLQDELREKLGSLKDDFVIYGIRVIRDELRSTARSKYHDGYNLRISLLELYDSFTKEHNLGMSPLANSLAQLYFDAYRKSGGSCGWAEMKNDFLIVAQATMSKVNVVVSDDNRTLASRPALEAYNIVNKVNNMLAPDIIRYKEFVKKLI